MIDSRAKGATFERKIAKMLTEALGIEFKRSPGSGAYATVNKMGAFKGDIITESPFPYCIECKKYADFNLEDLVTGTKSGILKWFEQLNREKGKDKGILIFQRDHGKIMMALESDVVQKGLLYWNGYVIGKMDDVLPFLVRLSKTGDLK